MSIPQQDTKTEAKPLEYVEYRPYPPVTMPVATFLRPDDTVTGPLAALVWDPTLAEAIRALPEIVGMLHGFSRVLGVMRKQAETAIEATELDERVCDLLARLTRPAAEDGGGR